MKRLGSFIKSNIGSTPPVLHLCYVNISPHFSKKLGLSIFSLVSLFCFKVSLPVFFINSQVWFCILDTEPMLVTKRCLINLVPQYMHLDPMITVVLVREHTAKRFNTISTIHQKHAQYLSSNAIKCFAYLILTSLDFFPLWLSCIHDLWI